MSDFTQDEIQYMEYLDSIYEVPGGYGLLLYKGDNIAFQAGLQEYLESIKRNCKHCKTEYIPHCTPYSTEYEFCSTQCMVEDQEEQE